MGTIELAPTTKANVSANASFGFSCYVKLSDTEKILVDVTTPTYDNSTLKYVDKQEKVQLEELHYHNEHGSVILSSMVVRGFRKDGALRFRSNYLAHKNTPSVIKQIPPHYHDYAKEAFKKEMLRLKTELELTIRAGVKI